MSRYNLYNTQIIEAGIDPLKSREFLPLDDIDVVATIPVEGGVALFYKNDKNNLLYGKFTLRVNEKYEGEAVPISEEVTFETNDIFITNGFYDKNESFYVFYNVNNNIYVRTFLTKQGFLGKEILVKENAKVLRIENIKENFFIVAEDLKFKYIIDQIDEINTGEIKIVTLFENDIIKFEGGYDSVLNVQELNIPFNDIPEEKWSCDNQVYNNKGFLYMTGEVKAVSDKTSINGYAFQDVEKAFVGLEPNTDEYTITFRCKISGRPNTYEPILEMNNIKIELVRIDLIERYRITYIDGSTEIIDFTTDTEECARNKYKLFTITSKLINDKLVYSVYFDNLDNQLTETYKIFNIKDLPNFKQDSLLIISTATRYDYLTQQLIALEKKSVRDLQASFRRTLILDYKTEETTITADEINYIADVTRLSRLKNNVFDVPSNAEVAINEYIGTFDDRGKTFWVCGGFTLNGGDSDNNTFFIEKQGTFINRNSKAGIIYAKADSFVDLNGASDFTVYYEKGATIQSSGKSTLLFSENVIFTYDNAPSDGCAEFEVAGEFSLTSLPLLPSNLRVNRMFFTCTKPLAKDPMFNNGDGTILDIERGLMWSFQPKKVPQDNLNNHYFANNFYGQQTLGGFDDWRMPTIDELRAISEFTTLLSVSGGISGNIYVPDEDNVFDFQSYIDANGDDLTTWSTSTANAPVSVGSDDHYYWDFTTQSAILDGVEQKHGLMMLVRDADFNLFVQFDDGEEFVIPSLSGQQREIVKTGFPQIVRKDTTFNYDDYEVEVRYNLTTNPQTNIYTNNHKLNSATEYTNGQYLSVQKESSNNDLRDTVLPIFINDSTTIPGSIFTNPEENIRVCQNLSQRYSLTPFKVDFDNNSNGITLWVNMKGVGDTIGLQYTQENSYLMPPTYSSYETLSTQTYSHNSYHCAYHFQYLKNIRRNLIEDITVDAKGEILLGGSTSNNTYLREVKAINFFDRPTRYKSSDIDVEIEVLDVKDRDSYINNHKTIREFVNDIVKKWKPSTINVREIVERNTLIMEDLLKDEFTQVLVGLTPRQNANAFYLRSVDSGEVSILSSSENLEDEIDWIGIGRINTPYVKSGVTKIKKGVKNIKIPFETRFSNNIYRVYVFSPTNSKYFVTQKDKDGFIVESSYLVEKEVAWIALNTNQVINGTLHWKKGLPENEKITDHLDRIQEVNENSTKYTLKFSELGFPDFDGVNYSVILSSDQNVNLWAENRTSSQVDVRRSYAGEDVDVDFLVVKSGVKWWEQITS